jgi:hypothetical protein
MTLEKTCLRYMAIFFLNLALWPQNKIYLALWPSISFGQLMVSSQG